MNNKKIALCLSGIVGGTKGPNGKGDVVDIKKIFNQYKKHILDKNNVDVFIHSWSEEVEDVLTTLYQPKKNFFEKQIDFIPLMWKDHKNKNQSSANFYSRWNSIKKVTQLKTDYEEENNFEYDIVMLSRLDLLWFTSIDFDNYNSEYFWVSNWNENGPRKLGPYDKQSNAGSGFLDFWFFSNSQNMDKFSFLYDNLVNGEIYKIYPSTKKRLSGHVISKQYTELLDFNVQKTMYRGFDHEVYRRYNKHCGEEI